MANKVCIALLLLALSLRFSRSASSCGHSLDKHLQTRIIDGSDIGYYKFPWFGLLKINDNLKCGCTLISSKHAITAASCFKDYLPIQTGQNLTGAFTVTFGVYNRCDESEATRKIYQVQKTYINGDFVKGKRGNNLAILEFSEVADFEPVCLPTAPVAANDRPTEGIITGAGMVSYQPLIKTCTIHEGRVLIYNNTDCENSLKSIGENASLLDQAFCAGGVKTTKPYGCGIDLGGPLTVTNNNGLWYILGVISFKRCNENDNVTLYQDVSQYLDWIHKIIDIDNPPATTITAKTTDDEYDDYDADIHTTKAQNSSAAPITTTTTTSSIIVLPSARKHKGRHGNHHHEEKHHENKHLETKHHKSKRHEPNHHETKHHKTNHHEAKHHETSHHKTKHHETNHHESKHHESKHHEAKHHEQIDHKKKYQNRQDTLEHV